MASEGFEYTQNIVIRMDLNISRGKICGQVAHAAVSAAETARKRHPEWLKAWLAEGQRKVVLKVKSLAELYDLKLKAKEAGLPVVLIEDRGLTQLPPGTVTCLGIGPAPISLVNKVTRDLLLL